MPCVYLSDNKLYFSEMMSYGVIGSGSLKLSLVTNAAHGAEMALINIICSYSKRVRNAFF